jgi:transcriptional regulator with XRE-family HTH domain
VRELRLNKRLSQRELAKRVARRLKEQDKRGFDFTYLSKIENGRIPHPSTAAILALAEELDVDSDELLALACKAPLDVGEKLQNPMARMFYRSAMNANLTEEDWQELIRKLKQIKR